ncbi:MAG: HD domain-containing protein [Actinobacteria bacterium]|nr:HD domain-containing protein [Actinomycetota bacterium]
MDDVLTDPEHELWSRMPAHDRRHSVAVARRVERALAGTPEAGDDRWIAAALLHDVGKLDSGLGVFARAGATLAGAAAGHDMADAWSEKHGITRRVGLYLRHAELGETRLRVIGARDEAAAWAGAHHDDSSWHKLGFPDHVVQALNQADDD